MLGLAAYSGVGTVPAHLASSDAGSSAVPCTPALVNMPHKYGMFKEVPLSHVASAGPIHMEMLKCIEYDPFRNSRDPTVHTREAANTSDTTEQRQLAQQLARIPVMLVDAEAVIARLVEGEKERGYVSALPGYELPPDKAAKGLSFLRLYRCPHRRATGKEAEQRAEEGLHVYLNHDIDRPDSGVLAILSAIVHGRGS